MWKISQWSVVGLLLLKKNCVCCLCKCVYIWIKYLFGNNSLFGFYFDTPEMFSMLVCSHLSSWIIIPLMWRWVCFDKVDCFMNPNKTLVKVSGGSRVRRNKEFCNWLKQSIVTDLPPSDQCTATSALHSIYTSRYRQRCRQRWGTLKLHFWLL